MRKRYILFLCSLLLLSFLFTPIEGRAATPSFQIDFIDVGQGDSALVQCDGHYMLIDGGGAAKSSLIYSYLKARSIKYIDVMVATHADEDHIGGLSGALNYANVGLALCPVTQHDTKTFNNFVKYLGAQGKAITVPKAGNYFTLGSASVYVLGPIRSSSESNNNSIVLRIVYGNTSFLFTGDAETDEEKDILASRIVIKSNVLKVAHHGSSYSTGYQFLREVAPQYAVISVGTGNSYGHPTADTLSKLRDAGVRTLRTDLQGDIICVSDGRDLSFYVQRNASVDTLAEAGAGQNSNEIQYFNNTGISNEQNTPDRSNTGTTSNPSAQTYVLNTNTHKFHYPNCNSVNDMKEKNKQIYTGSRDDIIAMGYGPCKRCNP